MSGKVHREERVGGALEGVLPVLVAWGLGYAESGLYSMTSMRYEYSAFLKNPIEPLVGELLARSFRLCMRFCHGPTLGLADWV